MSNYKNIVNNRKVAFGPTDQLMTMANIKYKWAIEIYERMEANTWFPRAVPLGKDRDDYRGGKLNEAEKLAYDKALAFVSNLDGIQFNNLIHNIGQHITAPEISLAIARQAAEEGVHVRSYQMMIEATAHDPERIYMMFETDGILAKKNEFIMRGSAILKEEPTPENFARALVSNLCLEGIYFYNMFLVFYALGRNGKMVGSSDMIKYINRDEGETHLDLFTHTLEEFKLENPQLFDEFFYADARQIILDACEMEMEWGHYVIGKGFPGLTPEMGDHHIMRRGNIICEKVGIPPIYHNVPDSVPWFESFSKPNSGRSNFFERKPTDYQAAGLEW